MASRLELQARLESIFSGMEVYFQPPKNTSLDVPSVEYKWEGPDVKRADNKRYIISDRYTITYMHRDPDDPLVRSFPDEFDNCAHDRSFISDNVYHDTYTLYF